jgi:hypothetical protein
MRKHNKLYRQVQKMNYAGSKNELLSTNIFPHRSHFALVAPMKPVFIGSKSDPLLYIDHVKGNNPGVHGIGLVLFFGFRFSVSRVRRVFFTRAPRPPKKTGRRKTNHVDWRDYQDFKREVKNHG